MIKFIERCLRHRKEHNKKPPQIPVLMVALNYVELGTIKVRLDDGQQLEVIGSKPGPVGEIWIENPKLYRRLLVEGSVGFGEMYMDGWWTTPDLQSLMDVVSLNNENMARRFSGLGLFRIKERLRHLLNANSRSGSKRNIAHHYDLGNDFYRLWLDETMTYSSALFNDKTTDLVTAQQNKYSAICDRLEVTEGGQILEIGCGWGGFAEYAIRERGLKITGLTISREQQNYAQRRLFKAGLAEQAQICLRDYRDERGVYDGIASIEMIEAVGEKYWPAYFTTLHNRLRQGSVAVIQAITVPDKVFPKYRQNTDFIQKHIFPGGMLLSPSILCNQANNANLKIIGEYRFADCYSRTLRLWRERFNTRWREISKLGFDNRFYLMWNFYLAASAAGFAANSTDVVQITCRREI